MEIVLRNYWKTIEAIKEKNEKDILNKIINKNLKTKFNKIKRSTF